MKIAFIGLDHVVLRVNNLDRMLAFYRDTLGCPVERRLDDLGLVQLRAGASLIDLVPIGTPLGDMGGVAPGREGRNMDHFCLRVDNFDPEGLTAYLQQHGAVIGPAARRYGADGYGVSVYVQDPEGNTVELKGSPETGG